MMRDLRVVGGLAYAFTRRYFRDKVALFFTFIFPVIFLLVFGSINRGNNGAKLNVALFNHASSPFATEFIKNIESSPTFKLRPETSLDDAKEAMKRSQIDMILELPENFGRPNAKGVPTEIGRASCRERVSSPV